MTVDSFLDTNISVSAAAGRGPEESRRKRTLALIESENFGLSAQVLQEFHVTVVRKARVPLEPAKALETDWCLVSAEREGECLHLRAVGSPPPHGRPVPPRLTDAYVLQTSQPENDD